MDKVDELIEQLSDKYGIPKDEVKSAVESQFDFVAKKMAQDNFPEIRLPYFGVFKAKESRIKHLKRKGNR